MESCIDRKFILVLLVAVLIFGSFDVVRAAFNEKINYQGKLTDASNTAVADGAYDVVFNLYTVGGGGSAIWTESWTNAALWTESSITFTNNGCAAGVDKVAYTTVVNESSLAAGQQLWNTTKKESAVIESVVAVSDYICVYDTPSAWATTDGATNRVYVKNGLFSVMLGGVSGLSAINLNQTLYLGVTVGADSEMKPRKMIGVVPAAIEAKQLGGKTWATPDAIGSGTPNTGAFTTFSSTGLTTVGNNSATVAIDSSDWNIDALGAMTGISGITSDSTYTQTAGNFAMSGIGTFGTGTGAVSLNGDTTIAANKNLTMTSGTGTFTQAYTGTITASTITANSLTSGNILSLASSSTAAVAGNTGLNIAISGANAAAAITRYGLKSAVTATNGTSGTNIAGYFSASGATTANYGLIVENGNVGIGTATPTSLLQLSSVSPQVSLIDTTNSSSAGIVNVSTLSINGTDPVMNFGFGAAEGALRHFNFRVGGVNLLTIRGSGYVGINDITPDGWLDIEPTGATTAASYGINLNNLATSSTASINKYGAYISSTGTWNGTSANNYGLYVDTPTGGTNNYAAIFAGGNVGIGVTNPASLLYMQKDQNSGTYLTIRNATAGTAAYETFRLTEDDSNKGLDLFHLNTSFTTSGILTANTSYIDSLDSGGLALGSRNAAGVVKFFTGGLAATNERMRIDSSGNVGIGDTAPTNKKLSVSASGAQTAAYYGSYLANTATSSTASINKYGAYISSTGTWNGTSANNYGLYVDTPTGGTNNYAAIFAGGNVGIGTVSPSDPLDVVKNQNANTRIFVQNTTAGTGASANIEVNNGSLLNEIGIFSASTTAYGIIAASDAYMYSNAAGLNLLADNANGVIKFATGGNSEKMRIDNAGNVGIGDTAPTNKRLSVSGSGAQTAAYYGSYLANTATSSTASINKYGAYISSTGTWNGTSANNYGLYIDTPTGGTNNYAAVFAGGNVGIGTATPDAALNVASGQISFGSVWSLALFNVSTNFSTAGNSVGMRLVSVLTPASGSSVYGLNLAPTAGSSTENIVDASTILVTPPAKGNSGTLTNLYGVKISTSASASTNAYGLYVDAPSGGSSVNAAAYFGGNVGIGTTAPAYSLDIQKDGDNAIVNTTTYGATFAGSFYGASARGTQASPTASQLDDLLGVFGAKGYGATGFSTWSKAVIMMKAAENWTDSAQGTYMLFATTAAGGTTRSERMRITDAGYVGIGLTPSYQFQLSTDSAAKPSTNTWTIASDERIKKDITPFTDGLSVIEKINPIWYKYNGLAGFTADGKENIGVLAQEIKDVAPYTVSSYMAKLHPDDAQETELFNFNSHALTFIMINAIKEQQNQIEELKLAVNPSGNIMDSGGEAIIASLGQSQSFKDLVASILRDTLSSLSGTIATAGEWTFGKITTQKLCVDDVCVDKSQLQELLNKNEIENQSNIAAPNDQIVDVDNANSDASSYFENN